MPVELVGEDRDAGALPLPARGERAGVRGLGFIKHVKRRH
jgi:hypothetical protein